MTLHFTFPFSVHNLQKQKNGKFPFFVRKVHKFSVKYTNRIIPTGNKMLNRAPDNHNQIKDPTNDKLLELQLKQSVYKTNEVPLSFYGNA